uniref:DNA methylase N-4/N-6 domain-containing protein n=1 Tax=viral metagenome TaxID=1070528 RepID=A0A6C0DQY2_9ZZZZ
MKLLSLEKFTESLNSKNPSYREFLSVATVRIGERLVPLRQYSQEKKIDVTMLKLLYENICNRDAYLGRFYRLSLYVDPDRLLIDEKPMTARTLNNNTLTVYKNLIRNIHWLDILKNTHSGIENVPTYLNVLEDLYKNHIIDYKILTPSSLHYMKEGRLGSVFSSYYFRASIMNPYLVYSLNMNVLQGKRIFTPTLGWSSYCCGFLQCPFVEEYVGTDVISSVCTKTREIASVFSQCHNAKYEIFCEPSENLAESTPFLNKYREHFDVVFFSPPYYRLELYAGKNQSTERYKSYEEWLEKYWEKTIQLCAHVLQKGGKLCYILSGYGSDNTTDKYDLLKDMNTITAKYFQKKRILPMHNKDVYVTQHKETAEKIMIFVKE